MEPSDFLGLLDDATRQRVVERAFDKGASLFRRGDVPAHMFYVVAGEARLQRNAPTGLEVVYQRTRRGFLAEASLDHAAYHCDGVAIEPTRALAIPIAGFRAALAHDAVRTFWLGLLGAELRRVRAHAERLALRSARDRILHYVETEGRGGAVVLTQSKKALAAELGLTHEALYRTLRAMADDGTLDLDGPTIRLRATA